MKDKTLDEILAELVRKRITSVRDETDETIQHYTQAKRDIIEWAKKERLEWAKGCVPEKKSRFKLFNVMMYGEAIVYEEIFNEAITQTIKNMEEG